MTGGNSSDGDCIQADDATSFSDASCITVGGTATLLVGVGVYDGTIANITNGAATWNGVSMTRVVQDDTSGSGAFISAAIFTLVSPTTGTQTLAGSWTTTADTYFGAASFTGTDTTDGIDETHTTTTGTTAVTITSTTDGATVAVSGKNSSDPTVDQTTIWINSPLDPGGGATYAIGGTSNTHTFTFPSGDAQAIAGIHIIAAAAGGRTTRNTRSWTHGVNVGMGWRMPV
jgi:hypothetical protein